MFAKSKAAALLRTRQRPLILVVALALMVSTWPAGSGSQCDRWGDCATPSRSSPSFEELSAVLASVESLEEVKADFDGKTALLVLAVLLLAVRTTRPQIVVSFVDPAIERRHLLPQKTGPPSC